MLLTLSYSILQGIKSFAQKFSGKPQYPFPDMTLLGQAKRLQIESKNYKELNNILTSLGFVSLENHIIYKGTEYSELNNRRIAENIIEVSGPDSSDYFFKLIQILLIIEKRAVKCFLYKKEEEMKSDKYFIKLIRNILDEINDRRKDFKSFSISQDDSVCNLLYFHYFSLFAEISLMWGNASSKKHIDKLYKFLKNKYILASWNGGLELVYDIIACTIQIEEVIKKLSNDTSENISQFTQDEINILYDKLCDYEEKHILDKGTNRHLARAFCAIIGCKLYAITNNNQSLKWLYTSIYEKNYCNTSYLNSLRQSLCESLQKEEKREIEKILQKSANIGNSTRKKEAHTLLKGDVEQIRRFSWKLYEVDKKSRRSIIDCKYRELIEHALVMLQKERKASQQKMKVTINKGMKLILYGFFFQFCNEGEKDKVSIWADFIVMTFEKVADRSAYIHNWKDYSNKYKEFSKRIQRTV